MKHWIQKSYYTKAFSLMELLVTVFIIGIVMSTIYFTLDNLRQVHKKEMDISLSQRQLQFIFYIFSQAIGRSELIECKENELSFRLLKSSISKGNDSSIKKDNQLSIEQAFNNEQNNLFLIQTDYRLTKVPLGFNWFFFLRQENTYAAIHSPQANRKKTTNQRFLFYHPRSSQADNSSGNELLLTQQIKESGKPIYLEWKCEALPDAQQMLHLSASSLLNGKNILLRKKSYLFHWRRKQK